MGQEAINLTTVVSGFDSGTNLDPIGVRQNNQGVTLAEANGFVSVDAAAPDSATGLKGDFSFNDADNKIYVCVSPFGSIFPGRVIPALTAPTNATTIVLDDTSYQSNTKETTYDGSTTQFFAYSDKPRTDLNSGNEYVKFPRNVITDLP